MANLLIVGGGLAGSMVAHLAQRKGYDVSVYDAGEPWAASPASTNLVTKAWLKRLGLLGETGFERLQQDWQIDELLCNGGALTAYHLPLSRVLWPNPIRQRVVAVENGSIRLESGGAVTGCVVIAAGIWTKDFFDIPIKSLAGHSLLFEGGWPEPTLKLWAPYRHLKIFSEDGKQTWFGDGTAIQQQHYDARVRCQVSLERAHAAGLQGTPKFLCGLRPVITGQDVVLEHRDDKLHVLTGGGKMGMTVYAATAHELVLHL